MTQPVLPLMVGDGRRSGDDLGHRGGYERRHDKRAHPTG